MFAPRVTTDKILKAFRFSFSPYPHQKRRSCKQAEVYAQLNDVTYACIIVAQKSRPIEMQNVEH